MEKPSETNADLLAENERLRAELASLSSSGCCCLFEASRPLLEDHLQKSCAIVSSLQDAVYATDTGGVILSLNPAFETITGLKREEWVGKTFGPLVHPDDFSRVAEHFAQAAAGVTASMYEARFITQSGEYKTGQFATSPYVQNGRVIAVVGIARDITEFKLAEKALKQSEQNFKDLVENLLDGVAIADSEARHVYVNPKFAEIAGYTVDELLSMTGWDLTKSEEVDKFKHIMKERMAGKSHPRHYERTIVRKDGIEVPVEMSTTMTTWKGKKQPLAIIRDITERKNTENMLRESEERYRGLVDATFEGIAIHEKGIIIEANNALARMLGYQLSEVIGMSVLNMAAPKSREELLKNIRNRYEKPYEVLGLKKDGSTFPVELTGKNIHYRGRKARVTVLRDITERKRSEIFVKTQRDLGLALAGKHDLDRTLRMCLDAALDVTRMDCGGIYLTNESGGLDLAYHTGFSQAFVEKNFQHRPDSPSTRLIMEGKAIYGCHKDLDLPINETTRREKLRGLAMIPILDEGRVIACLNMASHVVDEIDDFARASLETMALQIGDLIVQSITAEALRRSEERFRSIVNDSPDIIVIADADGRVEFINKTLGNYSKQAVIGMTIYDFVLPEFHDTVRNAIEKLFDTGQPIRYETKAPGPNGTISDYETRCMPLLRDGEVRSFISVTTDVTERKQAEEEKLHLERQVQHAQKLESLGVLAGGIAHDFNNLLMGVLGNADMALMSLTPESPIRTYIEKIQNTSTRLADLTQQMLAYSGKSQIEVETLDLSRLVEEMAPLLRASASKKVVLKCETQEGLPPVKADASQLRQVFMNLIINAAESYREEGGIVSVNTRGLHVDRKDLSDYLLAEELPGGNYILLEVSDTGCGMDKETCQKIFDPFFSTKFSGRGLGLASVLGIIRSHCGAIQIDSEPNQGTTFKILLPSEKLECFVSQEAYRQERQSFRGQGTVLLADDEEVVLDIGKKMLEQIGFTVICAVDGFEAVEQVRKNANNIVCVLLDLTMPKMDGIEAFAEIRDISSELPVIVCSGYDSKEFDKKFADKGITHFLQKPFRYQILVDKLQEVLK